MPLSINPSEIIEVMNKYRTKYPKDKNNYDIGKLEELIVEHKRSKWKMKNVKAPKRGKSVHN